VMLRINTSNKSTNKDFAFVVDNLFGNDLITLCTHEDVTPRSKESRRRGEEGLKLVLQKLITKKPTLWAHILREKGTIQEAKEADMTRIRKHWEDKGLGLFTRCDMTYKAWKTTINLTSHKGSKDLQEFVKVVLPGGTPMCSHASLNHIMKEREKIAEDLSISSRANETSTIFDVIKSLICRLEYLDNQRLLPTCRKCIFLYYMAILEMGSCEFMDFGNGARGSWAFGHLGFGGLKKMP
jgi:hypothetical protein